MVPKWRRMLGTSRQIESLRVFGHSLKLFPVFGRGAYIGGEMLFTHVMLAMFA
jgi:hypothetical protein